MNLSFPHDGSLLCTEARPSTSLKPYARILVAADLSPSSMIVLQEALTIAKSMGAKLLIAHAEDMAHIIQIGYMPQECYEQCVKHCHDTARAQLQPLIDRARASGVDAEFLPLIGSSADAILDAASQPSISLVIMGHHHRSKFERFFLGSPSINVLKAVHCPVLFVPLPKRNGEATAPAQPAAPTQPQAQAQARN